MSKSAMRTRTGFLILALAANLVLAGTLGAGGARACSCAGTSSTDEALRTSDAVFSGEVAEVRAGGEIPIDEAGGSGPAAFLDPVAFEVKESWKGVSEASVVVRGHGPEASCGLDFDEGETYLVFAYRVGEGDGGPLATDFCGATSEASQETALEMLGPPEGSLPDTGGRPVSLAVGPALVAAAALLAVFSALVAALRLGRMRRL